MHPNRPLKGLLSALSATALVLASGLLSTGCATGPEATPTPASGRPVLSIVASFYPIYIDVLQLTNDVPDVDVSLLAPPSTGCLHDYSLTGGDMKKLVGADVLVVNGAGMEGFLTQLAGDFPALGVVDSSTGVDTIADADGTPDPHVWTSPRVAALQVDAIAAGLEAADPAHAALYAANAARYDEELSALGRRAVEVLGRFRGDRVLAGHTSFLYFAREYGFVVLGIFGRDDGEAIGTGELARMIDTAKSEAARAVDIDPQFPAIAGNTIARETALPVCVFDSVATGTLQGPAAMGDYLDRMNANLDRLATVLGQGGNAS